MPMTRYMPEQIVIENWGAEYNPNRPHSTLDYWVPAPAAPGESIQPHSPCLWDKTLSLLLD